MSDREMLCSYVCPPLTVASIAVCSMAGGIVRALSCTNGECAIIM